KAARQERQRSRVGNLPSLVRRIAPLCGGGGIYRRLVESWRSGHLWQWFVCAGVFLHRQREGEGAALAYAAGDTQIATMCFGHGARHEQPLSEPARVDGLARGCARLATIEAFEDVRQVTRADAYAGIADLDQQIAFAPPPDRDRDLATCCGVFDAVVDQVAERPLQAAVVADNCQLVVVNDHHAERKLCAANARLQPLYHVEDKLRQAHFLLAHGEAARADLRNIEQFNDHAVQHRGVAADRFQELAVRRAIFWHGEQHLAHPFDRGERRAELV